MRRIQLILLWALSITGCRISEQEAADLARQAFHSLNANSFDPDSIRAAGEEILECKARNRNQPWVLIAESQLKLTEGYRIGDRFDSSSYHPGAVLDAFAFARAAYEADSSLSHANSHLARLHLILDQHEIAFELLKKAHARDESNFFAYYYMGVIFARHYSSKDALKHFEQARKYATREYERMFALNQMADAHQSLGNTAGEERLRLDIIAADRGNAYAYEGYGHFLYRQQRLDEAVEAFRSAVERKRYPNAVKLLRRTLHKRDSLLKSRI